ncbi:MAG: HD domain-containing protein [Verrucomicrobia bacterium]|nr:HD domain-containing protein [Verrucomicrobiota bacterium]
MPDADFRSAIADYLRANARPVDKYSHQPRLYALAKRLGDGMPLDDDVLYAAAWLHDIGVFVGHRPEDPVALAAWDNVRYAMEQTPALLRQFAFPEEKIAAVVAVITEHLPSASPRCLEAVLLRDADILEQLGAVGILRNVSKVGRDTRFHRHADAIALLRRNTQELPAKLQLPQSRQQAEARLRVMEAFLQGVEDEAQGQPV